MTKEELNIIHKWIDKNKLYKYQYTILLECYRRVMNFKKGDMNDPMLTLSTPSVAKKVQDLIKPYSQELKNTTNWYGLTKRGKKLINELKGNLNFNSGLNSSLFNKEF